MGREDRERKNRRTRRMLGPDSARGRPFEDHFRTAKELALRPLPMRAVTP
jgi:hypothetical protein